MNKLTAEEANELLPSELSQIQRDPTLLKYLLIAQPKWGKTTWMLDAPETILLATEEGHAFHESHKIVITSWDRSWEEKNEGWLEDENHIKYTSMTEAVDAIVAADRFKFVVIDTADMAAKMCLDYHYKKFKVAHAQDAGDYGKGWDICLTQPFRGQIGRLMKTGRGIGFITHSAIIERKKGNTKISREETTLPSQVQKFLHTQADVIIHGSFGKRAHGEYERDRVISLDGSNEILAGSRVRGVRLPKKFIVDPEHPFRQWTTFFEDEKAVEKAEREYDIAMGKTDVEVEAEETVGTISEPGEADLTGAAKPPKGSKPVKQKRRS